MENDDSKSTFLGLDIENKATPYKVFGIVIILWLSCWGLISIFINIPDEETKSFWPSRGQFGDMFGAVNALFSGLAFAGIILTILLQREELKANTAAFKCSES